MKKRILILFIIMLLLSMVGCIEQKPSNEALKEEGILTINIENMPKDLGFLDNRSTREEDLLCSLFDGLVELDAEGNVKGALAESYEVSKDGLNYTFKLRKDIKWSNGKAIVASDFVDFFKVLLNSKTSFASVSDLYPIFGAEGFNKGKNTFKDVAINALDNSTLQIRMNYAKDDFLKKLTKPCFRLRKGFDKLNGYLNQFNDIEYTGPFRIEDIKDKKLTLRRNEQYWDKAKEGKVIFSVESKERAIASFNSNKVNIIFDIPVKQAGDIKDVGSLEFYPTWDVYGILFNNASERVAANFKFKKVIEDSIKISYSNDKYLVNSGMIESKGEIVFGGSNETTKSTFNKSTEAADISKLNSFLKDIDFDKDTTVVNIVAPSDVKSKLMIDSLNKVLTSELNVKTNLKFANSDEYEKALKEGNFDLALINIKKGANKEEFYARWTKGNKFNYGKYENEAYDKLFTKQCKDMREREDIFMNLQSIIKRDIPYIPFYYDSINYIYSTNVKGIELDGNNNIVLKKVYMDIKG